MDVPVTLFLPADLEEATPLPPWTHGAALSRVIESVRKEGTGRPSYAGRVCGSVGHVEPSPREAEDFCIAHGVIQSVRIAGYCRACPLI